MNPEHRVIMAGTVGLGAALMTWTTAPLPEVEVEYIEADPVPLPQPECDPLFAGRTARQTRRAYGCKPDKPKSDSLKRILRSKGRR